MTSRNLSGRTAILAAALCSVAGCDVPTDATPYAEIGDGMIPGALATAGPPNPQAEPNLSQVIIEAIMTNGTGCPKDDPNSVDTVLSADKQSFIVIFNDMELTIPPAAAVKHLNCQVTFKLHLASDGYQIALAGVDTGGYLYLDEKIKAYVKSSYFFAGVPLPATPHPVMVGPYDGFYVFHDSIPFESLSWSDCGTSAVLGGINTALNLNATGNPGGKAIFNINTHEAPMKLHWQIRAC